MKKGFTLIEVMIAMAIAAMLFTLIFASFGGMLRYWKKGTALTKKLEEASFVLETIARETRGARAINSSSTAGCLILSYDAYNISYSYEKGKVKREKGEGAGFISDEGTVSGIKFSYPKNKLTLINLALKNRIITTEAFVRN